MMDKQRSATITQALMKWREGLELSRREQSVPVSYTHLTLPTTLLV